MIPWRVAVFGPAGLVTFASGWLLFLQQRAVDDVPVSISTVLGGVLLMLSTYLFTSSIRQGKEIAELRRGAAAREHVATLEAQQLHNADNIAILQGEAATIDRRIADSRHATHNELASMLGEMELRLDARMKEFREGQERLLALILERRSERRKTDSEAT